MNIRVNDEPRAICQDATIGSLIDVLGFSGRKGIAVAVNDRVVARSRWATQRLAEGDRVLVIQATQGG